MRIKGDRLKEKKKKQSMKERRKKRKKARKKHGCIPGVISCVLLGRGSNITDSLQR